MGQFLGQRYWKKRLSSEQWLERYKEAIWHNKNNGNNSTSTASTAALVWLSHFIQRLCLYPATRIPIHSLIISCLDYCNNVCAKLLFFFFFSKSTHYKTIESFRAFFVSHWSILAVHMLLSSLLFSYMCSVTYEIKIGTSMYHCNHSRISKSADSNFLSILQSICWARITAATQIFRLSFACLKYMHFHMFLCQKKFKYFILLLISVPRDQLNWQLFAALQHILSPLKQCTGCCNSRGFPQMSQCSHWKKMQQKAQYIYRSERSPLPS